MKPSLRQRRQISRPLRAEPAAAYERLSDPILVRRAKDNDRRALEVLCARHQPRVERICRRELVDEQDAQDAAQEALIKLCQRIGQFRGEARFSTWLHRLVVNTCRDAAGRRSLRRCEPLERQLEERPSGEPDPERAAVLSELRGELGRGLSALTPLQAQVVVLKDVLDLSFEQISARAGLPVGTAKCYAHRGRKLLRERLGREAAA
ncbi:MAG: RNA polymerase sigma factor [Gaiellaceae bacterium]